jgi:putative ABC transport system substrate-binding protein
MRLPTRRRVVIVLGSVLAAPLSVLAQSSGKIPRIGYLSSGNREAYAEALAGLRAGVRNLRYVEGKTIAFDYRFAQEKPERLPGLAAELVKSKVDVILTHGTPETRAAKQATSSIPIVMLSVGDPVGAGLVASLARPGGNITGLTNLDVGLAAKRLELLKEVLPKLSRIAILRRPGNPSGELQYRDTETAAKVFGITPQLYDVRTLSELEGAFRTMSKGSADALTAMADPVFLVWRRQIAELALANRLPSIFARNENVEAGGLISYGPSLVELYGQAASFVDKILKGAQPGELPIEQPAKFDLFINLRTAKALGITIPKSVQFRADKLFE